MSGSPLIRAALDQAVDQARLQVAAERQHEQRLTQRQVYALNPLAWLDDGLLRIYSKEEKRTVVFAPYQHQRELADEWINVDQLAATGRLSFRNLWAEKSRQMGETWMFAELVLWALTFHTVQGLVIHRNGPEVDDGGEKNTWKSIFGKVRFMHRHLPAEWRAPLHFRPTSSSGPARIMNLDRPEAWVYGATQSTDPGRGGTFSFVIVDEAAFVPWGEAVHAAVGPACPDGKAYLSTANGTDNVHYRIGRDRPAGWRFVRHHWSQHPIYSAGLRVAGDDDRFPGKLTSPWYEKEIADKTDEQVASELDIDYEASLTARVFTEWQTELHVHPTPFVIDQALPVEIAWDYGLDCTAVVICQDAPDEYRIVGELEAADQTPDQIAAGVKRVLLDLGWPETLIGHEWTRRMRCVGDPAGEARSLSTGRPLVEDYLRHGFSISSQLRSVDSTIVAVKRLLRGRPKRLVVSPSCELFVHHVRNNRWPTDRVGRRKRGVTAPLDDRHNHMMRAFAYLVADRFPAPDPRPETFAEPEERDRDGVYDRGIGYGMSL